MNMINSQLAHTIKDRGYKLFFAELPGVGYFVPDDNAILLNENLLNSNDVNFAVAHELCHLMSEHEELSALYTGSSVQRSKMEYEANYGAITMLIEVYIEETGIEFEQLNYLKFMEYFNIPTALIECVEGVYKSFTTKNSEVV